jgi:hypothetical protein
VIHWADDYSRWVRDRFPELGREPVYIRTKNELTLNVHLVEARAFTSLNLDLEIRDELASRDEWRGRGFACVISEPGEFFRASWPDQLGLVLHELSHHLAERPAVLDENEKAAPGGSTVSTSLYLDASGEWLGSVMRTGHGPEFVRAALHTFWRGRNEAPLPAMNVFWDRYGSPDAGQAITALRAELDKSGNIIDTLRKPMPDAFAKLWS